jgi:hypothetical protein
MLARRRASAAAVVASRVELFCDLARTAGLPHNEMVVILEHNLYQPSKRS